MKKKKIGQIKSKDHGFDLWLLGELLGEAVRLDSVKGFCNLIDNNPELADEYFERKIEKMGNIELPAETNTPEWTEKMLTEIYRKIESREKKEKD